MITKCCLINKNCNVLFVYEGRPLIFRPKTAAAGHPALNEDICGVLHESANYGSRTSFDRPPAEDMRLKLSDVCH